MGYTDLWDDRGWNCPWAHLQCPARLHRVSGGTSSFSTKAKRPKCGPHMICELPEQHTVDCHCRCCLSCTHPSEEPNAYVSSAYRSAQLGMGSWKYICICTGTPTGAAHFNWFSPKQYKGHHPPKQQSIHFSSNKQSRDFQFVIYCC